MTAMDAIQALKTRRSVRRYEQQEVSQAALADLVDCARLAPTAMNQQVWEFVVITDRAMLLSLSRLITHMELADVPAAIAVLARPERFWIEDCSAATQNILLAAHAHGLGACWISGESQPYADPVRKQLGAPDTLRFFCLISLGYPAEQPVKDKRPLSVVMHPERYGNPG